jgi:Kef-type K+ transport system membrane component KefB
MIDILYGLSIVLCVAAIAGYFFKLLGQPTVLAYLVTGLAIPLFGIFDVGTNQETLNFFSDLGIMFLLFLVGLEMNYTSLRQVGRDGVFLGVGQLFISFLIGFFLVKLFGFTGLEAFYASTALALSSTVIVIGLLAEKKDLNSLYGKLAIGLLLTQDFFVILLLIVLSGFGGVAGASFSGWQNFGGALFAILKGIAFATLLFLLGRRMVPRFFEHIARSNELVFVASLAWLFAAVSISKLLGFSVEIGGFLAGLALANSYEHHQVANRVRPLRDFFLISFFVLLGSRLGISSATSLWLPIVCLSLFVVVGTTIIVMGLMAFLGYRKRTSFFTGLSVAQVSEFSFVLMTIALGLGHIGESLFTLVTVTGIITIITSAYLIGHADWLFSVLSPYLSFFERSRPKEVLHYGGAQHEIVLIGFHRTGQAFAAAFPDKENLLIIDEDPGLISEWKRAGYHYLFGDMNDEAIQESGAFQDARFIISTCPDVESNVLFLKQMKGSRVQGAETTRHRPALIVRARTGLEAKRLYQAGADYVFLPHASIGRHLALMFGKEQEPSLALLRASDKALLERANR